MTEDLRKEIDDYLELADPVEPDDRWKYEALRALRGEVERLREGLDYIERRTKHADLPICKDINDRARLALGQP